VNGDVGVRHIGECSLIPVSFSLEDQTFLPGPLIVPEQPAADVETKLEGHVQAIVFPGLPRLQPGKVVDGVLRFFDQGDDLVDPWPA
jgi:hypothetical protein